MPCKLPHMLSLSTPKAGITYCGIHLFIALYSSEISLTSLSPHRANTKITVDVVEPYSPLSLEISKVSRLISQATDSQYACTFGFLKTWSPWPLRLELSIGTIQEKA